ncbi:uncharacterized protein SAPINGB_P004221 [Magnusiomyces paraingens]|uniref:Amino acid permease/ SLC12A domain-containing protein n=1 Tax=Magnusiomyces paraingens TaxID=2606893 RepID=A0A5E8BYS6_9ASCO|nr:uncharacterized protein SAPINGB_P004221 [Saprochaete ingens]VVT54727.1 unnamed protein product [Saprochaete ingens]
MSEYKKTSFEKAYEVTDSTAQTASATTTTNYPPEYDAFSTDAEKGVTLNMTSPDGVAVSGDVSQGEVKRQLKQRHVSMIALGGTIGTGLFIGTGSAISDAGPVGSLIAYIFMATVVYSLAQSIGEMATFIPITGSFTVFCSRFVSPALGASIGWLYWFSWAITFAIELSIVGQVIEFWTFAVPLAAWIGIFFVIFTSLNFFPVKIYGEIEFWAASIKVIAVVGWLIYALCMVCGAGKTGPVGFRYWRHPGPWGPGILSSNKNTARFLGWLSALINAAFTFQGTELVGITAGESANPRKTVPRAINRVFFRIVVFFIGSIFFMGLLVPYNDPLLSSDTSYVSSSPFIIAIVNSGTKVLDHIFNAVILTTILSAGNSNVYIGSRLLFALGSSGVAPKFFTWTSKGGVPYIGVICTALIGLLGFLSVSEGSTTAFNWLVNISTVAGLLAWAAISFSHIRFMKALEYHGIDRKDLPFTMKGGKWYAWYACISVICVIIIQGFTSFWDFNASDFMTAYISLFIFIAFYLIFQFIIFRGPLLHSPENIDIFTGRREEELVIIEKENMNLWEKILEFLF